MNNPVMVSTATYKDIEDSLQQWYESSHWFRMYKDGVKYGTDAVLERFDLVIEEDVGFAKEDVIVKLVSKEDSSVVVFEEVFDKYYGKIQELQQ